MTASPLAAIEASPPPAGLELVAEGVWLLRGDLRGSMNVYFVTGPEGEVVQFDAGSRSMTRANRRAAQWLGGVSRIVLGHAHADHRGTAARVGPPVHCSPAEVEEAARPEPIAPYFDLSRLELAPVRMIYPALLRWWDGGPVEVAGTVAEGDRVAGFEVVAFPGHSPGMVGLWRERDRVALVSDTVYLIDSARLRDLPEGEASVPHPAWNWDHEEARRSVLKLAGLEPRLVLAGHGDPLRGDDLAERLRRAAEKH